MRTRARAEARARAVIERQLSGARPEGSLLSGVEWQPSNYAEGLPSEKLATLATDGQLQSPYHDLRRGPPAGFEPAPPPPESDKTMIDHGRKSLKPLLRKGLSI